MLIEGAVVCKLERTVNMLKVQEDKCRVHHHCDIQACQSLLTIVLNMSQQGESNCMPPHISLMSMMLAVMTTHHVLQETETFATMDLLCTHSKYWKLHHALFFLPSSS